MRGSKTIVEQAPYQLLARREDILTETSGGKGEVEGLIDITGHINLEGRVIWPLMGEELTLTLSDGRRVTFFFRDQNGLIQVSGGFQNPDSEESADKPN